MDDKMQSESVKSLATALKEVQASLKPAKRSAKHPHYQHNYATLGDIVEAITDLMTKNGLSYVQKGRIENGQQILRTVILHTSGEWISGDYLVPNPKPGDSQAAGSSWSYARRYSIAAMTGCVTEDDDGQAATDAAKSESKRAENIATRPLPKPTEAVQKVFGANSDILTARFIPSFFKAKENKTGKMMWTVGDPEKNYYTTMDEATANVISDAKGSNKRIVLAYKVNGDFKNIVKVVIDEPAKEPEQEQVPF